MLKDVRRWIKGIGAWFVVALFILAFAFVGVPALDNFSPVETLRVGESRYSIRDIEQEFARRIERRRIEDGEVLSREEAVQQGVLSETIGALARRGLYAEEAEALGLTASDEMVQQYLNSREELQNPQTGRFDQTMLQRVLEANRLSLSEFRTAVRDELLAVQIDDAIATNTLAPQALAHYVALRQTEQRVVKFANLSEPEPVVPTEDDLRSYYSANADRYQTPEFRQYTILILNQDTLADRVVVTEEELRRLYDSRAASLGEPERRSYQQAVFDSVEQAEAVLARLRAGETLAAVAKELDKGTSTFTDQTRPNIADEAVADAVFETEAPGFVGPVDGVFGVVVADVQSITPAITVTFEDVQEELRAEFSEEIFREEIEAVYDELQQAGDNGATLEEAASDLGLEARRIGPVSVNQLSPQGDPVTDAPLALHSAAFRQGVDAIFAEVDLRNDGIGFVEVNEIIPAATQPFEEVAVEVQSDYVDQTSAAALAGAASAFRTAIADGQSFEDAAAAQGADVVSRTVSLFQQPDGIPESLLPQIFAAEIGDVVSGPSESGQTITVAQTDSLSYGPNAQLDQMTQRMQAQLGQTLSREYYDAYLTAMQDAHKVEQNDAEIAARFDGAQ